jgi:GH43 family beta-xylosidase
MNARVISNPLIRRRADPFICRHTDGYYYFTASVPEYDRVELRRSRTIAGLATAQPVVIWRKPQSGPMSDLIWAPEIHYIDGAWYVYFAAAPSREIRDGLFQHRIYVLTMGGPQSSGGSDKDPLKGQWHVAGRMDTGLDTFCLDATTFAHRGRRYFVWAQKHPAIPGNSNLYIAQMATATRLGGKSTLLTRPEHDWEIQGFLVNEGPAVLIRRGKVFIAYSASATDERYCMGLLHADESAQLLDPASWTKSPQPVFTTSAEREVFGPGHNSFTVSEDGERDLLVYHARNYREIVGDPLWNPDRHTCVQPLEWDANGMPVFGLPAREVSV